MATSNRRWWKEGVFYQVWPTSFKDSNADGIGDIGGIVSSLDYLKDLGVDCIWLSPMYESPQKDYGYDISNYEAVDPRFGTLHDMDLLIKGLHDRGMRLIMDLVVNHTSDQHRWFQASMESRNNEYSNYYVWRDPKFEDGQRRPPNNWKSLFGGSAWKYVEARNQYYLHLFLESMPDLNWEDSTVRQAIYKSAVCFWLDRGVDGFRVDVFNFYSKDTSFPDAPVLNDQDEFHAPDLSTLVDGPRMHEWMQEQRKAAIDEYARDIVLVGESGPSSTEEVLRYVAPARRELDVVFDFSIFYPAERNMADEFTRFARASSLAEARRGLVKSQSFISKHGAWATTFWENHDTQRSITRYGSKKPEYQSQSGKLLALVSATMSGSLFLYQGQEIGMTGVPRDWSVSDLKDPAFLDAFEETERKYPGDDIARQKMMAGFHEAGRDHARTPVQWTSNEPCAGFSTVQPWMRVNDNFRDGVNVQEQLQDSESLLNFWKRLLIFRKEHAHSLIYGQTEFLETNNENLLAVLKYSQDDTADLRKVLAVFNATDDPVKLPQLPAVGGKVPYGQVIFGTGPYTSEVELRPWEGRLFAL